MAINKTVGQVNRLVGTFEATDSMTQSTATVPQAVSVTTNATTLGMGTASGDVRNNLYTLAAGLEGQSKFIYTTATGYAALMTTQGTTTTTGQYVFTAGTSWAMFTYMNASWRFVAGNATIASTT